MADLIGHEQSYRQSVRIVAVDLSVDRLNAMLLERTSRPDIHIDQVF